MPFRDHASSLRDMQTRIDLTESFVKGMDFDAFREDIKTVAAVERMKQIIQRSRRPVGRRCGKTVSQTSHGAIYAA